MNNNGYNNRQRNFFDNFKNPNGTYHIPVWLIIVGFIINWMLGMGLLFAHFCEDKSSPNSYTYYETNYGGGSGTGASGANYVPRRENTGAEGFSGSEVRTGQGTAYGTGTGVGTGTGATGAGMASPGAGASGHAAAGAARRTVHTSQAPKKKKSPTKILTVLGIIALVVGVLDLPDSVQYLIWCIQDGSGVAYGIEDVVEDCIWILSGAVMLVCAGRLRDGDRRRSKIAAIVGSAKYMSISEIADALPASRNKTEKYLQQCIDYGVFGDKAYLDMRSDCLVVTGPAPMSKKEQEAMKAAKKAEQKAREEAEQNMDEYDKILKEIRDINDRIPGEEFSAKIDRLEDLTAKIFKLVQEQPEKQKKMRKFINYYLPTSLKLLRNYEQLDAQGIEGRNISEAKQQIEDTMDTMISAFEKQLDNLFAAESMDISADIAAMQNLMKADGLIENDLTDKLM